MRIFFSSWLIACIMFAFVQPVNAQPPELQLHWWTRTATVAPIYSVLGDATTNTVYVGAANNIAYGPPVPSGYGAMLDLGEAWPALTGTPSGGFVFAVAADGVGGWFIGGSFTSFDGIPRQRLARLHADGSLDASWNPGGVQGGVSPRVHTLLVHDGILYVGGKFTSAGGFSRYQLAAFDIAAGEATSWNQGFSTNDGEVFALAMGNDVVYAGGSFTSLGGETRTRLAALDMGTGEATDWVPTANGDVLDLEFTNGTVYAGGQFSQVNATDRNNIASIGEASPGVLSAWDPSANGLVHDIELSGDTIFVVGEFSAAGGTSRSLVAALDRQVDTNNALDWDPDITGVSVRSIRVEGGMVYIGGQFSEAGGLERMNGAAFSRSTGAATDWDPGCRSGAIHDLAYNSTGIYVGGNFDQIGVRRRPGVAAFNVLTGRPMIWAARTQFSGTDGAVRCMALKGDTLFLGGLFSSVNGVERQNLAAVNKLTGEVYPWEVVTDDDVATMAIHGDMLFVGGQFAAVNGVDRIGLAAIRISTGGVIPAWQADLGGTVNEILKLQLDAGRLYVSGWFNSIGDSARLSVAALDPATGSVLAWDAANTGLDPTVALAWGDRVYIKQFGGPAAFDATTGAMDTAWDCDCSGGPPYAGAGNKLYFMSGSPFGLQALDRNTGSVAPWVAELSPVNALERSGPLLFAVGDFDTVDDEYRRGLAVWGVAEQFEDGGTAVPQAGAVESLTLIPNPTTGRCDLYLDNASMLPSTIMVMDLSGRLVGAAMTHQGRGALDLDLTECAAGMYHVLVHGATGLRTVKLVVQR